MQARTPPVLAACTRLQHRHWQGGFSYLGRVLLRLKSATVIVFYSRAHLILERERAVGCSAHARGGRRVARPQQADAANASRLLRARRERPCGRRAAKERDELAPLHSITSSARASSRVFDGSLQFSSTVRAVCPTTAPLC